MKRNERELARLILCTMLVGGAAWTPSMASAADKTITTDQTVGGGTVDNDDNVTFGADNITLTIPYGTYVQDINLQGHTGCKIDMVSRDFYGTVRGTIKGAATGAEFTVKGGQVESGRVAGAWSSGEDATGGHVTVDGTVIAVYPLYGGCATTYIGAAIPGGNAHNNTVEIKNDGEVQDNVYGGMAVTGTLESVTAYENKVIITDGRVVRNVYGGFLDDGETGNAERNAVTISGASRIGLTDTDGLGNVYGGYTPKGNADSNTVTISGASTIGYTEGSADNGYVYGGYSKNGNAESNTATIEGGTIKKDVYGGYSEAGAANKNIVEITGGTINGKVVGGSSKTGNATGNTVKLTSSTANDVYGGYSESGDATGNTVTIVNDSLPATPNADRVCGGHSDNSNETTGNTVNLTNAYVQRGVTGGNGTSVSDNTLHLSGKNKVGNVGVHNFETIYIEEAIWGTPVLTLGGGITNSNTIDASALKFANPETIANGATMDLIKCTGSDRIVLDNGLASDTTTQAYIPDTGVAGVTVNAALTGSLAFSGDRKTLSYTAESNKATKLTFTDVEWKDSGALLDHAATLTNISFDGADVDTSNIHFTNIQSLEANKKMTLVSSFGDTVGTITGEKYTVGTTLEGKGKASLSGSDLIFTAETGVEGGGGGNGESGFKAQEQTHNAVMGAEAGMAALSAGNDFVGAATEGLSLASNVGADGVSSFAQMGGGSMRQETGSHIDVHAWNAIIALGHQNKQECGTTEYGAFFEYGTGNYTTFNGDERGDGSTRYTGGGLLAKYKRANGFYIEGSLRAGSVHDDARNVLRDVRTRVPYSYTTNAPYFGFHLGVGKEIAVADGNTVDVYGKYFFNRRNSVSFDAGEPGDHYDLDAVTSSVLRVGARYVMKREKWNFYGGLAYEYELDGEAAGTASNGGASAAIRGADVGGGSFRGEIGATMTPGDNSPWSLDLNLSGFAGKKQGFTGGVSVAFMF